MGEITVSREIMADLLSAKSKMTDMKMWVDAHRETLDRYGLLEDIDRILNAEAYVEGD